ncbi:DUF2786 domain-containing protein [Sphingobium sp. IP1]|uniref:DUF2786 domain-containing protein n=1 Tax=Sphingobium sp. IP1 TaxID=2021637 RepID=UPI0015D4B118|nr:DUF2786 domain-containing protein [Sphingobium sp. IP1]
MNTAKDALLAKIRKCLALAKSSNEHEAAAALAKASALMDEHGVSMDDIAMSEIGEATAKGSTTQRPPLWEEALCMTVRHAFGCKVAIGANLHRIYIGPGPTPEIASYAFLVLFRQLKAARQEYICTHLKRCRPGRKRQRADIFCEAWASAVYSKVKALMPAVPPHAATDRYIERRFSNLVEIGSRHASEKGGRLAADYWRGYDAGHAANLSQGVGASADRVRIA